MYRFCISFLLLNIYNFTEAHSTKMLIFSIRVVVAQC